MSGVRKPGSVVRWAHLHGFTRASRRPASQMSSPRLATGGYYQRTTANDAKTGRRYNVGSPTLRRVVTREQLPKRFAHDARFLPPVGRSHAGHMNGVQLSRDWFSLKPLMQAFELVGQGDVAWLEAEGVVDAGGH